MFSLFNFVCSSQSKIIDIDRLNDDIEIISNTEFLLDSSGKTSINTIIKNNLFRKIDEKQINFGSNQSYLWLKFRVRNISNTSRKFSLISKGIDSLMSYQVIDSSQKIVQEKLTGSHIPLKYREFASPYLTFSFELNPQQINTIYARIKNQNYPLSVSPFKLMSRDLTQLYLKKNDLLQSVYIGSMMFLLLFGSALLFFFKEWVYFYYLLCVLFSMIMMMTYNDYYYLIVEKSPLIIRNKSFFGTIPSILPIFYLFFAKEFLVYGYDKNGYLKNLTQYLSLVTLLVVASFLIFNINFYQFRNVLYIFISSLCSLTLVLLYRSIRRKYKPAYFFLVATVPVLLMGFLESLSEFHSIPVQDIHGYYYTATIFEMYVLTLGLSLKFKISQDEKKRLQAEVFAIENQVQENERQRIAQDLHDKLGGILGALKINISSLSINKNLTETEKTSLGKSLEMIDLTSEEVRNISHSLASSTLTKLGLVAMLIEMYQQSETPKIVIQNSGFVNRLSSMKEMALYAIIQECVNNALKHANANEIFIIFKEIEEKLTVIIEDDGCGFNIGKTSTGGRGLENINFRVKEHLRGDLQIDTNVGSGTVIMIKMKI